MNLRELKKMIAEEYRYWLAEQPKDAPGGAPMAPPAPGVQAGADDIDVSMGCDNSEATLRQIYNMLKAYFEGGAGAGVAPAGGAPEEMGDMTDMDAGDDMDMEDPGMDDGDDGDDAEEVEEEKEDKKDKKELKERFQKLANIVKG